MNKGFVCLNCGKFVSEKALGTHHRNHCPFCLWSKHLDRRPGDRQAACGGKMEPIGLTFKAAGEAKVGELMVVHRCQNCGEIRKNRIAGDDDAEKIVEVFHQSVKQPTSEEIKRELVQDGIKFLGTDDEREVLTQLYGKSNLPK